MIVKKIAVLFMALTMAAAVLLTGCGGGQKVEGTIQELEGLTIQVKAGDGNVYDFEINDDTELDADHQPEEGDPIEVEYKQEEDKNIALKVTVREAK